MKYEFATACAFLLKDAPGLPLKLHKVALPAVNHTVALAYAQVLDQCFSFEEAHVKPVARLYHGLLSSTLKHLLHKYNRSPPGTSQFKVWAFVDYYRLDRRLVKYVEYPQVQDLVALKREANNRTPMPKIKDEELDALLHRLCLGALVEYEPYSSRDFFEDFQRTYEYWLHVLRYMQATNL